MALPKIPDSVLEKLLCQCGRYLSSSPISIGRDGRSMCSDCINKQSPQVWTVAENFAYEAVASLFQFPCRYKHQGCPEYLDFNKVVEHEEECSHRKYRCPVNLLSSCNKAGTVSKLCQHYEQDHSELYLMSPNFRININTDFEIYRLMKVDNSVFLLQTKCSVNQDKLWFSAVYFGNANNASLIKYSIKLSSNDNKKRVMELEEAKPLPYNYVQMTPSNSVEVDIPAILAFLKYPEFIECFWNFNIPDQIKIKNTYGSENNFKQTAYGSNSEAIKCPHCQISMVPPIYCCLSGHITCTDCKGYYGECKGCKRTNQSFKSATNLETIARNQQHQCRWIHCNEVRPFDKIRLHELKCEKRLYKCPVCCNWSGNYKELFDHLQFHHTICKVYLVDEVDLDLYSNVSQYVLAHHEIFKFDIHFTNNTGNQKYYYPNHQTNEFTEFNITVRCLGCPSYADFWHYQIIKVAEYVPYHLAKKTGNEYVGTVNRHTYQESSLEQKYKLRIVLK